MFLPPFPDSLLDADLNSTGQLLFSRPDGDLLSRRDVNAPWRQACDGDGDGDGDEKTGWDAVCPGLRLYDLRHLHRTWLDEDHINETGQAARLGHKRTHHKRPPLNRLAAAQYPLLAALQSRWHAACSA
ncbi:hypothetical protein [Catellatospora paridis]|uniref:hypothetical protein n=1 Tax=Catellatospora paridis TaxID=1617086 RepID=UPI0012D447D5|nr:hypothetical protein [Catellatospora paridis]